MLANEPAIEDHASTIWDWVNNGCPGAVTLLQRPSSEKYRNTFVLIWTDLNLAGGIQQISLDVHYEGEKLEAGKPLKALGSLWVKGMDGALKPEQQASSTQKQKLLAHIGDTSPDPKKYPRYGRY
ncbi:hypothetical protein ACS7SF_26705 (plasmid) [Ralstonia sp. 25C]|uniref:hypothetical protein n=1 Tax=Ralstonia sp. 25C TaxID=3447363 RepID=UPI003F74C8AF